MGGLAGVALGVAGCGGSSSGLSKSDYVAKADAICKASQAEVAKLTDPATPADLGPWLTTVLKLKTQEFKDLKALEAPSADKAKLASMLDLASKQVPALAKALAAATAGDANGAVAAIQDPAVKTTQDDAS